MTTHPHTFSKLPYKVQDDFVPLTQILRTAFFITVAADSPFKTVEDLVAAAKAKPGVINYGSWFIGSPGHIGAVRLEAMKGLQMTHVPFRDFGALYAAVSTKEVDWALGSAASAGPMQRSGRLRFLALAAPKRDPLYPDVPATAEMPALRGFEVSAWTGLFGPQAMPQAARDRVVAEVAKVMAKPEVVERYRTLGFEAPNLSGKAFNDLIVRETRSWGEVIRAANFKLD
jgi:tripartite-type tricarboxylate transporter receptor subunit TctC